MPTLAAAQPYLVKDINPDEHSTAFYNQDSSPSDFADIGGATLFAAKDDVVGTELWRTDGTVGGTYLLVDIDSSIYAGSPRSSSPAEFTPFNGALYFAATSDVYGGRELWKTDGTVAGTAIVDTSIFAHRERPRGFVVFSNHLWYVANDFCCDERLFRTGTNDATLQVSSGLWHADDPEPEHLTVSGGLLYVEADTPLFRRKLFRITPSFQVALVKDINPSLDDEVDWLTDLGGTLFFAAREEGFAQHRVLWKTDGTEAGTEVVVRLNPGASDDPKELFVLDGELLFSAIDPVAGHELFITDGTAAGTSLLKDIHPSGDSFPSGFFEFGGEAYFVADDGSAGRALWKTDGTAAGTVLVKDIHGYGDPELSDHYVFGGELYFTADDGVHGREVWKTDGTTAGTVLVKDVRVGRVESAPSDFHAIGSSLFFAADSGYLGRELWVTDGTQPGTSLFMNVNPVEGDTVSSDPAELVDFNGTLLFNVDDGTSGLRIYESDGTDAGTDLLFGSGFPTHITHHALLNGVLLFADDELYRTDGTPEGTWLVEDVTPGAPSTLFEDFVTLNGVLYFIANDELWRSDGTDAGTFRVDPGLVFVQFLVSAGGQLFFSAGDGSLGNELWKSDGTQAGTVLVKDIRPGSQTSFLVLLTAVGNEVYFAANGGSTGRELWKSDGTEAGTVLVKDIRPGSQSSDIALLTSVGGLAFFRATDGVNGSELWVSDGTGAGTVQVKDIMPGSGASTPAQLVASGGLLFFVADDGVGGKELWRSDGTTAGTVLLRDIVPGAGTSVPAELVDANGMLFFTADDGVNGRELWGTDGTGEGTRMLANIADDTGGTASSDPTELTLSGGLLYFAATTVTTGRELWALDPLTVSACNDNIDNDGDGVADFDGGGMGFPDPGCLTGLHDLSERSHLLACDDGVDNDNDGRTDFDPATRADLAGGFTAGVGDIGCQDPRWTTENPACDDGVNNDGDGLADWDGAGLGAPDPQCVDKPWRKTETPSLGCGNIAPVGTAGLATLLLLIAMLRWERSVG